MNRDPAIVALREALEQRLEDLTDDATGRIAERTGSDLRRVSDLIEILIAARLAEAELVASHNHSSPN